MSAGTFRLLTAATHFVPALLWGTIAHDIAVYIRRRRPHGAFPWLILALACATTLHYATWVCAALLRSRLQGPSGLRTLMMSITDTSVLVIIALARHVGVLWSLRATPPTWRWLALNYGLGVAAVVAAVSSEVFILAVPGWQSYAIFSAYLLVLGIAIVFDFRRGAERGTWRPGVLWQARSADVVAIAVALAIIVAQQSIPAFLGTTPLALLLSPQPSGAALAMYAMNGTAALVFATPFVVRNLGDLLPNYLTSLAAVVGLVLVQTTARAAVAGLGDPEAAMAIWAAAVVLVVFGLMPARTWLHATIGRILFRRGRLRWAQLHTVVHALPPEAGVVECCRRALVELVRIMQLRGAGVLLHDGEIVTHGTIDMAPIRAVWPRDGRGIPSHPLATADFRDLAEPVTAALSASDVLAVVPIASPRRLWGWLFVSTDLRGASFGDEDDAAVAAAVDQLALTLAAAHLLARTVAVERSLAHAEKLAAIGELAARFAHEIRNPITAARSLAQQLARDPASPLNAEHAGIIIEELERVERQVRDLLRFSRREEAELAPLDVGALVRSTAYDLRARLDDAGIAVGLDTADGVVARADREKLRQVLVNLVENAIDALGNGRAHKRIDLSVAVADHDAVVRVTDDGPGIPGDAQARIFDPFVSLKPSGTGLGLAIAKRTIDAHHGTIVVTSHPGATTFEIRLPLAEERP
jgi:signal transduction histidine kinase